jgi:hypothetical protein
MMPSGFLGDGIKSAGWPLSAAANLDRNATSG